LAADSPNIRKVNEPMDSRSPRPDIVSGIFPIKIMIGNVMTAIGLKPADNIIK
jgi:hypothetical protein